MVCRGRIFIFNRFWVDISTLLQNICQNRGKGTAIFSNVRSNFLKNICVCQKFCLPLRSKEDKWAGNFEY